MALMIGLKDFEERNQSDLILENQIQESCSQFLIIMNKLLEILVRSCLDPQ